VLIILNTAVIAHCASSVSLAEIEPMPIAASAAILAKHRVDVEDLCKNAQFTPV